MVSMHIFEWVVLVISSKYKLSYYYKVVNNQTIFYHINRLFFGVYNYGLRFAYHSLPFG